MIKHDMARKPYKETVILAPQVCFLSLKAVSQHRPDPVSLRETSEAQRYHINMVAALRKAVRAYTQ